MKVLSIVVMLVVMVMAVNSGVMEDPGDRGLLGVLQYEMFESEEDAFSDDGNIEAMTCDCDYHKGGCTISDKAPPGLACKCKYKGFWTCGGEVTHCKNDNNYYCKHPDRSYQSCKQGGGDCGGYRETTTVQTPTNISDCTLFMTRGLIGSVSSAIISHSIPYIILGLFEGLQYKTEIQLPKPNLPKLVKI